MDALHRAACLRIFDESSRVTARDAKRIDRRLEIEPFMIAPAMAAPNGPTPTGG